MRAPEKTSVLFTERAVRSIHHSIILRLPCIGILLRLGVRFVKTIQRLANSCVSPAVRGAIVPVGIESRILPAEALDLHRQLASQVPLVVLLARLTVEILLRVVDEVNPVDDVFDSSVLGESGRVGRIDTLHVRQIELALLGEESLACHIGHFHVKLAEL